MFSLLYAQRCIERKRMDLKQTEEGAWSSGSRLCRAQLCTGPSSPPPGAPGSWSTSAVVGSCCPCSFHCPGCEFCWQMTKVIKTGFRRLNVLDRLRWRQVLTRWFSPGSSPPSWSLVFSQGPPPSSFGLTCTPWGQRLYQSKCAATGEAA